MEVEITTAKAIRKVKAPDCWEQVTTDQFQKIFNEWDVKQPDFKEKDPLKLFSILTGLNLKGPITESMEPVIWSTIRFVYEQPLDFDRLSRPKFFKGVELPEDIQELSIGQNIAMLETIEGSNDLRGCISMATAIYLQPLIDKDKFNMKRVKALNDEILKMPAVQIYPIGFFLLRRQVTSGRWRRSAWHRARTNHTKNESALCRIWRGLFGYLTDRK
jgi:hypothetical protein